MRDRFNYDRLPGEKDADWILRLLARATDLERQLMVLEIDSRRLADIVLGIQSAGSTAP